MYLIGMMHHRNHPTKVRAYACAAVAKAEGYDLLFFLISK